MLGAVKSSYVDSLGCFPSSYQGGCSYTTSLAHSDCIFPAVMLLSYNSSHSIFATKKCCFSFFFVIFVFVKGKSKMNHPQNYRPWAGKSATLEINVSFNFTHQTGGQKR